MEPPQVSSRSGGMFPQDAGIEERSLPECISKLSLAIRDCIILHCCILSEPTDLLQDLPDYTR